MDEKMNRAAQELLEHCERNKYDIDIRVQLFLTLLKAKEYKVVVKEAIEIVGDNVHSTQYHYDLVERIVKEGFAEEFIKSLTSKTAALHKDKIYYLMGLTKDCMGKLDEAFLCQQEVISVNPKFAEAYYNMANIHTKNGNNEKAFELLKKSIRINSRLAEAHFALGVKYYKLHQYKKAMKHYKVFIRNANEYLQLYKENAAEFIRIAKIINKTNKKIPRSLRKNSNRFS